MKVTPSQSSHATGKEGAPPCVCSWVPTRRQLVQESLHQPSSSGACGASGSELDRPQGATTLEDSILGAENLLRPLQDLTRLQGPIWQASLGGDTAPTSAAPDRVGSPAAGRRGNTTATRTPSTPLSCPRVPFHALGVPTPLRTPRLSRNSQSLGPGSPRRVSRGDPRHPAPSYLRPAPPARSPKSGFRQGLESPAACRGQVEGAGPGGHRRARPRHFGKCSPGGRPGRCWEVESGNAGQSGKCSSRGSASAGSVPPPGPPGAGQRPPSPHPHASGEGGRCESRGKRAALTLRKLRPGTSRRRSVSPRTAAVRGPA